MRTAALTRSAATVQLTFLVGRLPGSGGSLLRFQRVNRLLGPFARRDVATGPTAGRFEDGRHLEVDQPAQVTRFVAVGLLLLLLLQLDGVGRLGGQRRLRGRRQVLQRAPSRVAAGDVLRMIVMMMVRLQMLMVLMVQLLRLLLVMVQMVMLDL